MLHNICGPWRRERECEFTTQIVLALFSASTQRPRSTWSQTDAGTLISNRIHLVPQQSPSSGGLDFSSSSPRTQESESLPQTPPRPEPVRSSPTPRTLTLLPVASPPVAPATP
ncbi:hypothetical protein HPB52_019350 [Rhipicephalus sanguineus]|nr:hypothetical protein HPB52_019350 [Rhipicephalus sanguineus]